MKPKIKVITGAAIVKDDKLLLVQEGKKHCYKQWNLPAGHLEYGEEIIKSAVREVYEETGYRIKITGLNRIYNYFSIRKNQSIRFNFIGEITEGSIKFDGKEILNVRWFSFDEIKQMPDEKLRDALITKKIIEDITSGKVYPLGLLDESI